MPLPTEKRFCRKCRQECGEGDFVDGLCAGCLLESALLYSNLSLKCPACHQAVETTDATMPQIVCPSCGSRFQPEDAENVDLQIGALQHLGRFEMLRKLGSGAFGAVWQARDMALERMVAIKVPLKDHFADPEEEARFIREGRIAAQLRHPGIVTVYEVNRIETQPIIISELVQGVTLEEWIENHPPTFRQSVEWMAQIADALHYSHLLGVVHRDLKPSNIMLENRAESSSTLKPGEPGSMPGGAPKAIQGQPVFTPRLMDFGMAKRQAGDITLTQEGCLMGTPAYMSPEQIRTSHEVDGRADIYSLGVILYELLTGKIPFEGTPHAVIHQVLHDEIRSPRLLNNRIPRDLETIVRKCIEKDPSQRYQTAGQVAEELRRWLDGEPIHARPVGLAERLWRWGRREPALAFLTVIVLITFLSGFTGILWQWKRVDEQRQTAEEARRDAEHEKAQAIETAYFSLISLAERKINESLFDEAREILQRCPREFRHWEWGCLVAKCWPPSRVFHYPGSLRCVAYSPDGKRILAGGWEQDSKLWNVETGKEIFALKRLHAPSVAAVNFSFDGKRIFTVSAGATEWNAETGEMIHDWSGMGNGTESGVSVLRISPDCRRVLVGYFDATIGIWDVATGKNVLSLKGHTKPPQELRMSPDGKRLLSGSDDNTAMLWDVENGKALMTFDHPSAVYACAFDPTGRFLLTADSIGMVKLWDAKTGRERASFKGHTRGIGAAVFDSHGKSFLTGSSDQTAIWWDVQTCEPKAILKGGGRAEGTVLFGPDDKSILGAGGDRIRIWQADTLRDASIIDLGHGSKRLPKPCDFAFSPDGRRLLVGRHGRPAEIWDVDLREVVLCLKGTGDISRKVAFSPDGKSVLTSGTDTTVRLWNAADGSEKLCIKGHSKEVRSISFSPDGGRVLTASADQTAAIWNARNGAHLMSLKGHQGEVGSAVFSPDGKRILTGSTDQTIRIWDSQTGRATRSIDTQSAVLGVTFSPDGHQILAYSADGIGRIWNADTGKEVLLLTGHSGAIRSSSYSPDGARIVTAVGDGTVRLWHAKTGKEILRLEEQSHQGLIRLSPDGRALAICKDDGKIVIQRVCDWTRSYEDLEREKLKSWNLAWDPEDSMVHGEDLKYEWGELLRKENFDRLETIARDLQMTRARLPDGCWKESVYYNPHWDQVKLERWLQAKPQSVTAKIALAQYHYHLASESLGIHPSALRDAQSYREQHLNKALSLMEEAGQISSRGMAWYWVMLSIASNERWDRDKFEGLFKEAVAANPMDYRLYFLKACYLQLGNRGKEGEWEQFAEETATGHGEEGMMIYARMVWSLSKEHANIFKETRVDWSKTRQGFMDLDQKYACRCTLNWFARFACQAGDRETTRMLFERIGDRPNQHVWKSFDDYDAHRRWALAGSVAP